MWSRLPCELLELIFTDLMDGNRDVVQLIQLQLTCKQWSPVAQRYLYQEIKISHHEQKNRMSQLTETVLGNTSVREWIRIIDFGSYFQHTMMEDDPTLQELAALAHLCPNITTVTGRHLPPDFFDVVSELRFRGGLQYLQCIDPPEHNLEKEDDNEMASVVSYNKAIIAFKDTLKNISVIDGVGGYRTTIKPNFLQKFSRVQHLHLDEFSRFHLSRMGTYISNCCPKTTTITISLGNLSVKINEEDAKSIVTPVTQVQRLVIEVSGVFLVPSEMAFIMRMFPSLQSFSFDIKNLDEPNSVVLFRHSMEVVAQFFDYLSLIPKVEYKQIWFDVSEGLDLVSHVANTIDVQDLYIIGVGIDELDAVLIGLNREVQFAKDVSNASNDSATDNTKRSTLIIQIWSTDWDTESHCHHALNTFKNKSIRTLALGSNRCMDLSMFPFFTEDFMDDIIDGFPSLQELTLNNAHFPVEELSYFKKNREDYFTQLFTALEHVDQFTFSTTISHEVTENGNIDNIRICVPYTSINTLKISISDLSSYTIKVWSGCTYSKYDVVEEDSLISSSKRVNRPFDILIYCQSLQVIRTISNTFTLP
ncbi:hypothetical protein MBANPS3_003380 [Mucor bainieri]